MTHELGFPAVLIVYVFAALILLSTAALLRKEHVSFPGAMFRHIGDYGGHIVGHIGIQNVYVP